MTPLAAFLTCWLSIIALFGLFCLSPIIREWYIPTAWLKKHAIDLYELHIADWPQEEDKSHH